MKPRNIYKAVFFLFFLLLSAYSVSATLDDAVIYWSMDDVDTSGGVLTDLGSYGADGGIVGADTGQTGILDEAYGYVAADANNRVTGTFTNVDYSEATISAWYSSTTSTTTQLIHSIRDSGGTSNFMVLNINSGYPVCGVKANGAGQTTATYSVDIRDGNFHRIVCSYEASTRAIKLYVDGYLRATSTLTGSGTDNLFSIDLIQQGFSPFYAGEYVDGDIDDSAVYDRLLTDGSCSINTLCGGEIASDWNSGAGVNPYNAPPVSDFFDITAADSLNGSILTNITVTFSNGTSYQNETGQVVTLNITGNHNFTVSAPLYFNQTFNNYNVSVDLQANLTRYPYINLTNAYTNEIIDNFNISLFTGEQSSFGSPATGYISVVNQTIDSKFYFEYNDTINITVQVNNARTTETQYEPQTTNKINHSVFYPKAYLNFSNYVDFNNSNYTRSLTYTFTASYCSETGNNWQVFVNGSSIYSETLISGCQSYSDENFTYSGTYSPSSEGTFIINASMVENVTESYTFIADLNNPTTTLTVPSTGQGFRDNFTSLFALQCTDTIFPSLTYNMSLNFVNLFYGNLTSGTTQENETDIQDGSNYFVGVCSDPFNSTTAVNNFTAYVKVLNIINEKLGTPLVLDNITQLRAWFDDNSTFYDFIAESSTSVNVIGVNETKIRLEITYPNDDIIVRYLDLLYMSEDNVTICGMPNGTAYYEQLLISSSNKVAVAKNQYTGCYISSDTTRFAYQDTNLLRAYTIDSSYYLYTYDNGQQVLLASLDGSVSSAINLDRLQFGLNTYDLNFNTGSISVDKTGDTEMRFYYRNLGEDLSSGQINVTRMDTNEIVFTTTDFDDINEFTLYFDYSTLSNVTEETLFKLSLSTIGENGVEYDYIRYFNTDGNLGILTNGVAIGLSFLLALFGLTVGSVRFTFSWLGIVVMLGAIGVISLATGNFITLFLLGLYVVMLVYIIIAMLYQNQATIA